MAGSLRLRMIALAAAWIVPLLGLGGFALDRVLVGTITRNFDAQLEFTLSGIIFFMIVFKKPFTIMTYSL